MTGLRLFSGEKLSQTFPSEPLWKCLGKVLTFTKFNVQIGF